MWSTAGGNQATTTGECPTSAYKAARQGDLAGTFSLRLQNLNLNPQLAWLMPPSAAMLDHLASNVTWVIPIWTILAADGTRASYCGHTRNVTFNSIDYTAAPVEPSRFSQTLGLQANHVELFGVFDTVITESDVQGGRWKNAKVVFEYIAIDPATGAASATVTGSVAKIKGQVGKISIDNGTYKMEIRSLSDLLHQEIGSLTSPLDRNRSPEALGVSMGPFTFARTVTAVVDKRNFTAANSVGVSASGYFIRNSTPTDGETLTVNGAVFTFRNSPSGDYEIQIDVTAITLANNIVAKLNASTDPLVAVATYSRDGLDVLCTYDTPGTIGNSFTTAASGINFVADGPTLLGGVNGVPATAQVNDYFKYGRAEFVTGANAGLKMEIKASVGNVIELQLPMRSTIAIGDTLNLIAGYDSTREQARDKFAAMENFDGEPDLPGIRAIIQYPE